MMTPSTARKSGNDKIYVLEVKIFLMRSEVRGEERYLATGPQSLVDCSLFLCELSWD